MFVFVHVSQLSRIDFYLFICKQIRLFSYNLLNAMQLFLFVWCLDREGALVFVSRNI